MSWKERIKSFLDFDWTKTPYVFILILSFILSRIPLLNLGFGADGDGWNIANSAFDLRYLHVYHASRFPGYPLPEYVNSLIIDHGWIATNSMTMILSLISVIFFAAILKDLNIKNKGLLVLTYAFLPVLWVNSTNTMDYMWALAFIVSAWFFILKKQYALAGLMMGLAIGSRITSVVLILPFLYLIWTENRKIKNIIYFGITVFIASFVLFLPLCIQHGFEFLTYYHVDMTTIELMIKAGKNGTNLFGRGASLLWLIVLLLSAKVLFRKIIERDKDTLFLFSSVVLIFVLFIKAPYEPEYLIPMIPFGLLLMNKICKRELIVILCIFLLLNSFVSFPIVGRNDEGNLIVRAIDDGMIKRNIEERTEQIDYTKMLIDTIDTNIINHSVVILGWQFTQFSYLYKNDLQMKNKKIITHYAHRRNLLNCEKDIWYRDLVPLDELQELQGRGYTFYYLKGVREITKDVYGYDLNDYNCVCFDVEQN